MIIERFNRTNFISQDTNSEGMIEWDLLLSNWDMFEIKNPVTFDTVKYLDVQRPDMLSFRIYGSSQYWWILCKFNQIDDVWNDMSVGQDLIIPSLADINAFYKNVRKKVRTNV